MLSEELTIINKIQKYLKENYQNIGDAMIGGGIDNMEKYKYMILLNIFELYLVLLVLHLTSAILPLFSPFLITYF